MSFDFHAASNTWTGYYDLADLNPVALPLPGEQLNIPVTRSRLGSVPWSTHRPGRVFVQQGKAIFTDIDLAKKFLQPLVEGTIFQQVVDTLEWPVDATHKVVCRLKAWPCDYETYTRFFKTAEETQEYLANQREWALSEDNYFELISLEEWDLGPSYINELDLV